MNVFLYLGHWTNKLITNIHRWAVLKYFVHLYLSTCTYKYILGVYLSTVLNYFLGVLKYMYLSIFFKYFYAYSTRFNKNYLSHCVYCVSQRAINSTVDLTIKKNLVKTDRFHTSLHRHPLLKTMFLKVNADKETYHLLLWWSKFFSPTGVIFSPENSIGW